MAEDKPPEPTPLNTHGIAPAPTPLAPAEVPPVPPPPSFPVGDPYVIAVKAVFWIICAGVFVYAFRVARPFIGGVLDLLTPFILALMIAYMFQPIVHFFERRWRVGRAAGITTVVVLLLLIVGVFAAILAPVLYVQTLSAIEHVSDFVRRVGDKGVMTYLPPGLAARIKAMVSGIDLGPMKPVVEGIFGGPLEEAPKAAGPALNIVAQDAGVTTGTLTQAIHEAVGGSGGGAPAAAAEIVKPVATGAMVAVREAFQGLVKAVGWVGGFLASVALTAVVTLYYLAEMSKIPGVIRRMLPKQYAPRVWDLMEKSNRAVGGFIRGQAIACFGVGILSTILLLIIGPRNYAVLIGFTAGALNAIPYLGPSMGAAPSVLYGLLSPEFTGWGQRALYIVMAIGGFSLVQSIDGFIFQPFIVGPHATLHPLAVMVALVVGAQFGIGGMIVAVPVACVVKVLWVELYWCKTTDFMREPVEGVEVEPVLIVPPETPGGKPTVEPAAPTGIVERARLARRKGRKKS